MLHHSSATCERLGLWIKSSDFGDSLREYWTPSHWMQCNRRWRSLTWDIYFRESNCRRMVLFPRCSIFDNALGRTWFTWQHYACKAHKSDLNNDRNICLCGTLEDATQRKGLTWLDVCKSPAVNGKCKTMQYSIEKVIQLRMENEIEFFFCQCTTSWRVKWGRVPLSRKRDSPTL